VRDAEIIAALAALVEGRPSRGFWKCRKLLRRQGKPWNHKRIYRVYCRMKLNLRRRAKRRLPKRLRVPLYVPRLPDTVWTADFMSDALFNGRRFRTFNVIDDYNREGLAIEVDLSLPSQRVIRVLEQVIEWRGKPAAIRLDNGPEYIAQALVDWANDRRITLMYIQPGKPRQNAYIERFNRTVRHEWLDLHVFDSIEQAQQLATQWLWIYNNERPIQPSEAYRPGSC